MSTPHDAVRGVVTVVYTALLASVGACAVMLQFVPVPHGGAPPRPVVEWVLLATGPAEYAVVTVLGRRWLAGGRGNALVRARSYFLVRFAAAQAAAVFGLAVYSVGSPASHAWAFFGVSAALLAVTFPGRRAFAEAVSAAQGSP